MLPTVFDPILTLLQTCLHDLPHPWVITGSLGLALQGLAVTVHDVDLQTTRPGALEIADRLAAFCTLPVTWREAAAIRSWFGAFDIDGVKVEVMGDVEHRLPDGRWTTAPDLAPLVRWVDHHGLRLPVMDLEHDYHAYRLLGRVEKAETIRRWLLQNGRPPADFPFDPTG